MNGDADFANFAEGEGVVGVHADLRWEIEGDGEAGLAPTQKIAVALVGFDSGTEAGVLTHGPETAAVHGGIDAGGKGKFAGIPESGFGVPASKIFFGVEAIDRKAGESGELLLAFGGGGGFCFRVSHGMKSVLNTSNNKGAHLGRWPLQLARAAKRCHGEKHK